MSRSQSALAAALLVAACAGGTAGTDRAATFLTAAPPPAGRSCFATASPRVLPAAGALLDSGRLAGGVRSGTGQPAGYALVSLRFDASGGISSIRSVEGTLPGERRDSVERLVLQTLKPQAAAEAPWSIRLKVTSDSAPSVRVGRSEYCPAVLTGPLDVSVSRGRRSRPSSGSASASDAATPSFAVLVDTTGRIVELRLNQSSGDPDLDRQMEDNLRQQGFRPALLDGAPVLAWTAWPPAAR